MSVEEPLPSWGLVSILIQPMSNLSITHTTVMEFLNRVMKELLVFRIDRGKRESC